VDGLGLNPGTQPQLHTRQPRMNRLKFVAGEAEMVVEFPRRDFDLLPAPESFMPGGGALVRLFGVFEDFDVAAGASRKSEVTRGRLTLLAAVRQTKRQVERDADLLSFNYSYSFSTEPKQRNGGAEYGFRIDGRPAGVTTRPKGFCTVTVHGVSPAGFGRPAAIIDLRVFGSIDTDDKGSLRSHKRSAELVLPGLLKELEEFLDSASVQNVRILNRW
jgi:hypothetical protein